MDNDAALKFLETRKKLISKLQINGKDREGFTPDIYDAVTNTYLYYEYNFPGKYNSSTVPDKDSLNLTSEQTTVADVYLARLSSNVKKISSKTMEATAANGKKGVCAGTYWPQEKEVGFNTEALLSNDNLKKYINMDTASKKDIEEIKKKLSAKLFIHELCHATSTYSSNIDNTRSGFSAIGKDNKWQQSLEENQTEELSLDVSGDISMQKSYFYNEQKQPIAFCYVKNPESAFAKLNALNPYLDFVYDKKELQAKKMINPSSINKELINWYETVSNNSTNETTSSKTIIDAQNQLFTLGFNNLQSKYANTTDDAHKKTMLEKATLQQLRMNTCIVYENNQSQNSMPKACSSTSSNNMSLLINYINTNAKSLGTSYEEIKEKVLKQNKENQNEYITSKDAEQTMNNNKISHPTIERVSQTEIEFVKSLNPKEFNPPQINTPTRSSRPEQQQVKGIERN